MSALSALVSAYADSDDDAEESSPVTAETSKVDNGRSEVPEVSAVDLLFQRVDVALAFEAVLPAAVYDGDSEFGEKVRLNQQRSREMGMGVVEYVRTKGNFNNPELIRLIRSQLPYPLKEYGTNFSDPPRLDSGFLGSALIKEQDRLKKEKDQERLKKERAAVEVKSPQELLSLQRTASRWATLQQPSTQAAGVSAAVDGSDPSTASAPVPPVVPTDTTATKANSNPSHSPHSLTNKIPSSGHSTPTSKSIPTTGHSPTTTAGQTSILRTDPITNNNSSTTPTVPLNSSVTTTVTTVVAMELDVVVLSDHPDSPLTTATTTSPAPISTSTVPATSATVIPPPTTSPTLQQESPYIPVPESPTALLSPASAGLFQGILTDKQQQALRDPAALGRLSSAEQQQLLGAIKAASQKLVVEAKGVNAVEAAALLEGQGASASAVTISPLSGDNDGETADTSTKGQLKRGAEEEMPAPKRHTGPS